MRGGGGGEGRGRQSVDRKMNHFRFWQKMELHSDHSGDFNDGTLDNSMYGFQGTSKRY